MNASLYGGVPTNNYSQLSPSHGSISSWNSPANTVMLFEVQGVGPNGITLTSPDELPSSNGIASSAAGLGSNSGAGGRSRSPKVSRVLMPRARLAATRA